MQKVERVCGKIVIFQFVFWKIFGTYSGVRLPPPADPLRIDSPYKPSTGRPRFPILSILECPTAVYIEYLQILQIFKEISELAETGKCLNFMKNGLILNSLIPFKILNSLLVKKFSHWKIRKFKLNFCRFSIIFKKWLEFSQLFDKIFRKIKPMHTGAEAAKQSNLPIS